MADENWAKRHDLLPRKTSHYYRQVVILGGGLLAVCIAGYMMMIAPNRSYPAGQAAIAQAEQVLQADQSAIPASSPQLIALDQSAVSQAKANLARAQQVDRLSAGALAFVEIPLSEAAVLGGELLVLYLAVAGREQARQVKQRAEDAVAQRDARFVAELTQILINQGRGEESVRRIIDRGNAMNSFASLSLGRPRGPGADLPIQHRQRAHRLPVLAGVTRDPHSVGVNRQHQPTAPAPAPLPVGVPQPPDQPGPHHDAKPAGANGFQDPADHGLSGRLEPPAELMPTDAERRQDLQQYVRGPLADRGDRPGLGKRRRRRG